MKKVKRLFREVTNPEEVEKLEKPTPYKTKMETPLYICAHPNRSDRVLRIVPKGSRVWIISGVLDGQSWVEVEAHIPLYTKGFVLGMFLEEDKEEVDA